MCSQSASSKVLWGLYPITISAEVMLWSDLRVTLVNEHNCIKMLNLSTWNYVDNVHVKNRVTPRVKMVPFLKSFLPVYSWYCFLEQAKTQSSVNLFY